MLDEKIKLILANIETARGYLREIETTMTSLEQAGMYPAVPNFQLQDRNGSGQYMYLLFQKGNDGRYTGPDGKRKIYIGADPKKQNQARLLAYRREVWEELKTDKVTFYAWIITNEAKIARLEAEISRYVIESQNFPKFKLPVNYQ